jgi:hypothetical protein
MGRVGVDVRGECGIVEELNENNQKKNEREEEGEGEEQLL